MFTFGISKHFQINICVIFQRMMDSRISRQPVRSTTFLNEISQSLRFRNYYGVSKFDEILHQCLSGEKLGERAAATDIGSGLNLAPKFGKNSENRNLSTC